MPSDRYMRIILTVIAFSLSVIALRPSFSPAVAGAQNSACGLDMHHPCYIAGWGPEGTVPIANTGHLPLKVVVVNLPMPLAHHR